MWFACVRGDVLETHVRAAGVPLLEGLSLERTARPWRLASQIGRIRRALRELEIDLVARPPDPRPLAGGAGAPGHRDAGWSAPCTIAGRSTAGPAARWLLRRTDALIAVSEGIAQRLRAGGSARGARGGRAGRRGRRALRAGRGRRARAGGARSRGGARGRMRRADGAGAGPRRAAARGGAAPRAACPTARLVLVGRGEHRPALERLVRELGLGETVVFAGYRGADLPAVLAALDCVVFLGDGIGGVLPGRPRGDGRRDARSWPPRSAPSRRSWSTGRQGGSSSRRPTSVAACLEAALRDRGRARRLGEAGRRRVEALFTPSRRAALVEAVYAGVLAKEALPRR